MIPYIILNCAASIDGKIALPDRQRLNISSEEDFTRVHKLRAECDAIIIGINTVIEDNPKLTVNPKYSKGKSPLRVVLDTNYRTPEHSKIVNENSQTLIAIGEETPDRNIKGIEIFRGGKDKINLKKLIRDLGNRGIEKIMVEGGETVIWSFIEENLFDEFNVYIRSIVIGGKDTPTIAGGDGFLGHEQILHLKLEHVEKLGAGVWLRYIKSKN